MQDAFFSKSNIGYYALVKPLPKYGLKFSFASAFRETSRLKSLQQFRFYRPWILRSDTFGTLL
jgi:hypothetical protein